MAWRTWVFDFAAMAAPCSIQLDSHDPARARRAANAAIAEVRRIEQRYSRYQSASVLSRINRDAARAALAVDAETAALLDFAANLWRLSDGSFDISSGVLRQVWDFKAARLPTPEALQTVLARVGWQHITWSGTHIGFGKPGMEIDFGGIGKEYAADRAAHMLRQHGILHALVNLGGDLHALGPRGRPDLAGQPWLINIRHPRQPSGWIAQLPLLRGGLASSGDYERYFEIAGRRYCHILEPRSGQPVTHWQSISVLSANTSSAGALSTIAMLKQASALPWLDAQGVGYLAVRNDGQVLRRNAASEA